MAIKSSREQLIQWLLDCGAGIAYEGDDVPKETTEKERTDTPFGNTRYVRTEYADLFVRTSPFPEQIDEAIEKDMGLIEFDEWQAVQKLVFHDEKPMDSECAAKISCILWQYHDETPLDWIRD